MSSDDQSHGKGEQLKTEQLQELADKWLPSLLIHDGTLLNMMLGSRCSQFPYAVWEVACRELETNPRITTLHMKCEISPKAAKLLERTIPLATSLTSVSFTGVAYSTGVVECLFNGIAQSRSVEYVCCAQSGLNNKRAQYVAHAIRSCPSLLLVDLEENNIGPQGCEQLGQAIAQSSSLMNMILYANKAGDLGCAHLAEGIRQSPTFHRIDVSWNAASPHGLNLIASAFRSKALRQFLLGDLDDNSSTPIFRSFFNSPLREVHLLPIIAAYIA